MNNHERQTMQGTGAPAPENGKDRTKAQAQARARRGQGPGGRAGGEAASPTRGREALSRLGPCCIAKVAIDRVVKGVY